MRQTALLQEHIRLGGRMVDFGGWELPVQYTGVMEEHDACRNACGIFDVSHMGEVLVEGPDAEAFVQYLVTNDVSKLQIGQAQYTAMCHSNGGIVDDLVIYRRGPDRFFIVVNASNTEKDFSHMEKVLAAFRPNGRDPADLRLENKSAEYTQIALQGREAAAILSPLTDVRLEGMKTYWFGEGKILKDIPALIARTGYTGEDGFEIYVPWKNGPEVWRAILEAGQPRGLRPCGLGARDTLRLEMKYALYGHELSDETNPLETGLGWVTRLEKPGDFMGKSALIAAKEEGLKRHLVGIRMTDRGIARQGYPVLNQDGNVIGVITSGSHSPSLKQSIAIAFVDSDHRAIGTTLQVQIRGSGVAAEVVATPFYKRPYSI